MDDLSAFTIDTRLVYGFKGAGKTSYIRDCILNDFFYKRGNTLILCFEQGKETFDEEELRLRNTFVAYYDEKTDIERFCLDQIGKYDPGRIYVEMSAKLPTATEHFPEIMNVTYTVTWFDWATLDWYFECFKQEIGQMVSKSQQVTFRGCPSRELLAPYSQAFQLMNHTATYLRQDPLGFHEKAFDLFVPYSLDDEEIMISENEYLVFWLDGAEHPEHYEGKLIRFTDPLELRKLSDSGSWSAGRVVMTCCMADLQFMSFELTGSSDFNGGWIIMEAFGRLAEDEYRRRVLKLEPSGVRAAAAPSSGMVLQVRRI